MFPWNPSPRKAEAGGYRVKLPSYVVRLSQNTKQKKHNSAEEHKRTTGLPLDGGSQGMDITSVGSCKWRGRSENRSQTTWRGRACLKDLGK